MTGYPAAPAAALFLAPAAGRSTDLTAAITDYASGNGLRIGERIGGALPKANPDTGDMLPLLPCPFAAIILGHGPIDLTLATLRALVGQAASSIDIAASTLLVGTEYAIKPGEGSVLVAMLVRRRSDLTPAAFRNRWLGEHAPFGLRIPVSGYRQMHADPTPVTALPTTDRFDGAGFVLFRDPDHVTTERASPEIARDATRDEMQFVDHGASMLAMFRFID